MKSIKDLFWIICLAILVRIPWLLMVPHVEAPDENTHLWVIEFIIKHFQLPDYQAVLSAGPEAVYGSIPPFGYLPHIIFYKCLVNFIAPAHTLYAARLGSLSMGLIVITVAYFIGQLLFLPNRIAALALPLMIVFHPQFVFVTSYINNDATAAALSALILLLLVRSLKNGLNLPLVLFLSLAFSWLILCKYSGYCVLVVSYIFLPVIVYLHRNKLIQQLARLSVIVLITIALTSWWFVRNYFLFSGDITGVSTMHHIWQLNYHKQLTSFGSPIGVLLNHRFWRMLFFSFWGWFGYLTRSLPRVIYYSYLFFVIVSIVRFCDQFVEKIQKGKVNVLSQIRSLFVTNMDNLSASTAASIDDNATQSIQAWIWLLLITCFLINFATCVYGSYSGVAGPQGRYLFPSEIPIIAMLIAGLSSRQNKWSEALVTVLVGFNLFAYCYSSLFLYMLYHQM